MKLHEEVKRMDRNMKQTKLSRIPTFKTIEEEANWWDTHSFVDYMDELKPVKVQFAKNLSEGITIRFAPEMLTKLRTLGQKKGVGPTTLARMWIMEHLQATV